MHARHGPRGMISPSRFDGFITRQIGGLKLIFAAMPAPPRGRRRTPFHDSKPSGRRQVILSCRDMMRETRPMGDAISLL